MLALVLLVAALASLGHAGIWIFLNNRLNATGLPRKVVKPLSTLADVVVLMGPMAFLWLAMRRPLSTPEGVFCPGEAYALLCAAVALGPLPWSLWRRAVRRAPAELVSNHTQRVELREQLGDSVAGPGPYRRVVLAGFNETLDLEINQKRLQLPRLPAELEGLRIAHLSDFHFTGRIGRAWFEEVVRRTNAENPDLVAITGDFADRTPTIDWIPETLGKLRAPLGVYYVLGNHDQYIDTRRLQDALAESGLIHAGGRWISIPARDVEFWLGGDEAPWIPNSPEPPFVVTRFSGFSPDAASGIEEPPQGGHYEREFRILLAHTPDRIGWARRRDIDLLLAGHTHGGQIRFPVIGPIVSPSYHGVKYASGVFFEPPTLMHVSRGISGKTPLRINCPPELAVLTLVRG